MYISLNFVIETIKIKELVGKKSLKNKSSFPLKFGQRCIFTAVTVNWFQDQYNNHCLVNNLKRKIHFLPGLRNYSIFFSSFYNFIFFSVFLLAFWSDFFDHICMSLTRINKYIFIMIFGFRFCCKHIFYFLIHGIWQKKL